MMGVPQQLLGIGWATSLDILMIWVLGIFPILLFGNFLRATGTSPFQERNYWESETVADEAHEVTIWDGVSSWPDGDRGCTLRPRAFISWAAPIASSDEPPSLHQLRKGRQGRSGRW